ncbi:exopolyphosphatase PRUNE1 isoform X3 [Osmerus mordax]|uniref:exopolyphosphatase PRUNE1 isoform X3 n=1 Tax=Osmerus mordax TaxID=8014 RepID=UPI00350EBC33
MPSMETFLQSCHGALKEGNTDGSPGFHVVLGNEACDLDSMVCALVYAYFLSKTLDSGKTPLAVLNIPRAEFPLRTDNVFLLRESGLSQDYLVFRNELDLAALQRAGRLDLTLVDHNVLPSSDSDLEGAVVEVIDHHFVERASSPSCAITVETVASCATLVTEKIFQKAPDVLDQQVAQLLYGTIVLDCVNMAPEAGKVTPKDSQYAALLETRFPGLPPRAALFQSLQNAKFDVSGLTTEQMLLKDMKAASGEDLKLAVSVIYMTMEKWLRPAGGYDHLLWRKQGALQTASHLQLQHPLQGGDKSIVGAGPEPQPKPLSNEQPLFPNQSLSPRQHLGLPQESPACHQGLPQGQRAQRKVLWQC